MTFRTIVADRVRVSGPRVFLVDAFTGREFTYEQFHGHASAVAACLQTQGVKRGDRVATAVPNCAELAVLYFACLYCGATIVPVNPNLSLSEVRYILENARPRCTVLSSLAGQKLAEVVQNPVSLSTSQEPISSSARPLITIDGVERPSGLVAFEAASDGDLALIVYTSGTTARPKGLAHHIGRMVRNASAFARAQDIDAESRFYLTLSMAYMGGLYNLLLLPFLAGASVVVDHVFDARSSLTFWDKATKFGVNTLWLAPTVLSILLKMDRGRRGEDFCRASVKKTFVGFAPLPLKLKADFEARYGVGVTENYGLSETLFVTARSRTEEEGQGYVGEALPGIELRVAGESGRPVPSGEEGEIEILSPDLMSGYISENGELQGVDAGAWFPTGDYGHLDLAGSLFITGRKKDLIIRGGVNISPAAIEEVLVRTPHVSDAAVVSVPHEIYGEDIVAVLKLEAGASLDSVLESVMGQCKQLLASHQQPSRYVAIDEFPRTSNGKIQKAKLRELVLGKLHVNLSGKAELSTADQGSPA